VVSVLLGSDSHHHHSINVSWMISRNVGRNVRRFDVHCKCPAADYEASEKVLVADVE